MVILRVRGGFPSLGTTVGGTGGSLFKGYLKKPMLPLHGVGGARPRWWRRDNPNLGCTGETCMERSERSPQDQVLARRKRGIDVPRDLSRLYWGREVGCDYWVDKVFIAIWGGCESLGAVHTQ